MVKISNDQICLRAGLSITTIYEQMTGTVLINQMCLNSELTVSEQQ
jgi:hypothetical protein